MQQPIMYQFTSVADDTTLSKRKLKLPVEMANAFTTSGDTVYVSTSGTDNASCGRAIALQNFGTGCDQCQP